MQPTLATFQFPRTSVVLSIPCRACHRPPTRLPGIRLDPARAQGAPLSAVTPADPARNETRRTAAHLRGVLVRAVQRHQFVLHLQKGPLQRGDFVVQIVLELHARRHLHTVWYSNCMPPLRRRLHLCLSLSESRGGRRTLAFCSSASPRSFSPSSACSCSSNAAHLSCADLRNRSSSARSVTRSRSSCSNRSSASNTAALRSNSASSASDPCEDTPSG
jgi:hypothetical protein